MDGSERTDDHSAAAAQYTWIPQPTRTLTRRMQIPYLVDHTAERLAKNRDMRFAAHFSGVGVKATIPSGLILAGATAGGAVGHVPSMIALGGLGVLANVLSARKSHRQKVHELELAEDALFDPWADDVPSQGVDGLLPVTYTDPRDLWRAVDRVRAEFPETRPFHPGVYSLAMNHIMEGRMARHADRTKSIETGQAILRTQLTTIIEKSPFDTVPVAGEMDPELDARLIRFLRAISPGVQADSTLDVNLPGTGVDGIVARYSLGEAPEMLAFIPYNRREALATAPPFGYDDLLDGWDALDYLRYARGTFVPDPDDPEAPWQLQSTPDSPYLFPELREEFPLPNDAERQYIEDVSDALRADETPPPLPKGLKLESDEAIVRANPRSEEAESALYGALERAVGLVLEHTSDNAFPQHFPEPMHRELDARLGAFAGWIGRNSKAGCVFDVTLYNEDGSKWIARYAFEGDGSWDLKTFSHAQLMEARQAKAYQDLNVPAVPAVSYTDPHGIWNSVDRLCSTFPEVNAAIRELFPTGGSLGSGEEYATRAQYGFDVAITQVAMRSTQENLLERLLTAARIAADGAIDDTALTIPLDATAVLRFTFRDSQVVRTELFTPEGPRLLDVTSKVAASAPAQPAGPAAGL